MSKRDITTFLIGMVCGGAIVGGSVLIIRPPHRVEVVAMKPESPQPQGESARSDAEKRSYVLDGFCPVTLIEKRQWTLGNVKYRETRGTQVFLFAGSGEQKQFQNDPERYLPAFSGNDVVLAKENGETARGKREHGITYKDRIYLFATEESLQRFSQNPGLYITRKGDHPVNTGARVAVDPDS